MFIRESIPPTPVVHECDVCVIGGSCTGVFAAVAAARLGAKVAVVEGNGCFGGVATAGLVSIWHKLYDMTGARRIIAGLTLEMIDRLRARGDLYVGGKDEPTGHYVLNTEELKIELDRLTLESGVRPFLHTRFVAPYMEEDRVVAAVVEDKTGRRAIRAACFIDATGDGDLIARAGFPTYKRPRMQPPTMCAIIQGLEELARRDPDFALNKALFNPNRPDPLKPGFLWKRKLPRTTDLTMISGTRVFGADCSDAEQLTQAEIEGRRQVRRMVDILRADCKGGEVVSLTGMASYIGIRETRHISCLHTLTQDELLGGVRFPDAIANGTYPVDIHQADSPGIIFRHLDGTEVFSRPDARNEVRRWRDPLPVEPAFYQIPYRCLVPQGSVNLLAAGRVIDADEGAFGAIRVMVNCNQTGQAAGVAAAMAVKAGKPVADIDVPQMLKVLKDQGAAVVGSD